MANLVSVRILFDTESQAKSALVITEGMIKLLYVPKELSKCFPEAAFTAFCRHEETVSATVQLIRIMHRDNKLIFAEMYRLDGDERDEDDWSCAATFLLRDNDGVFVWSKR